MIKIDENYSLSSDGFKGCSLVYSEERTKQNKKGETVPYTFKEHYYFPSMEMALQKYVSLEVGEAENLNSLLSKLADVEKVLMEVKDKFRKEIWFN